MDRPPFQSTHGDVFSLKPRILVVLSLFVAVLSCGPAATIKPLYGESELVQKLVGLPAHAYDSDAVTTAAAQLVEAVNAKNYAGIWQKLTHSVRQDIVANADLDGNSRPTETVGSDALRRVDSTTPGSGLFHYFFGGTPVAFSTRSPDLARPQPNNAQTTQSATIYARLADGSIESVHFAFSGTSWQFDGRRPLK